MSKIEIVKHPADVVADQDVIQSMKGRLMAKWLETFISEKGLDLDETFEVEGESGVNVMPYAVVVEHILIASTAEQRKIKDVLVQIDFANGDVKHFLRHLAQAIAA